MTYRITALLIAAGLFACTDDSKPAEPDTAAAAEAAPEPEPEPVMEEQDAYVIVTVGVKKVPSDDKKVDDPTGKSDKPVSNWVATLNRGETVTMLDVEGDYAKVRLSDGENEGWMKKEYLLTKDENSVATVFEETKTFGRPALASVSSNKVMAGSLIFVGRTKDDFSEANYPTLKGWHRQGWVLTKDLTTDSSEVGLAELIGKIRQYRRKGDAKADEVSKIAREMFGSTKLIGLLDEMEKPEEPAEAEAAAAPAAGTPN